MEDINKTYLKESENSYSLQFLHAMALPAIPMCKSVHSQQNDQDLRDEVIKTIGSLYY
jgi:hypothetical protein